MQRVATTHAWMAERFEQVLVELPPSVRRLARSVTAIIIGSDVRPSFYWRQTAAIYLDPALLWLGLEEKRSIDPAPDFRSGFGSALNFRIISRYVSNNDYAWYSYDLNDDSERELSDILAPAARLLFHELAHAGDFFPPDQLSNLDPQLSARDAALRIQDQGLQLSQRLDAELPLQSQLMFDLARVNFLGVEASDAQLQLSSEDVAHDFSPDRANDDYSYTSRFEDVAMLFEELMMDMSYDIQRDVAVTDRPAPGQPHIVTWGQRRRIAEASIQPRVRQVAENLLPQTDFSVYFSTLAEPVALRAGASWNDNLDPAGQRKASVTRGVQRRALDQVFE